MARPWLYLLLLHCVLYPGAQHHYASAFDVDFFISQPGTNFDVKINSGEAFVVQQEQPLSLYCSSSESYDLCNWWEGEDDRRDCFILVEESGSPVINCDELEYITGRKCGYQPSSLTQELSWICAMQKFSPDPESGLNDAQSRAMRFLRAPDMETVIDSDELRYDKEDESEWICEANDAYPAPGLRLLLDGRELDVVAPQSCSSQFCDVRLTYGQKMTEDDHGKALSCVAFQEDSFSQEVETRVEVGTIIINGMAGSGTKKLSTGAIVGISMGSLLLLILLILLIAFICRCCCFRDRKKSKTVIYGTSAGAAESTTIPASISTEHKATNTLGQNKATNTAGYKETIVYKTPIAHAAKQHAATAVSSDSYNDTTSVSSLEPQIVSVKPAVVGVTQQVDEGKQMAEAETPPPPRPPPRLPPKPPQLVVSPPPTVDSTPPPTLGPKPPQYSSDTIQRYELEQTIQNNKHCEDGRVFHARDETLHYIWEGYGRPEGSVAGTLSTLDAQDLGEGQDIPELFQVLGEPFNKLATLYKDDKPPPPPPIQEESDSDDSSTTSSSNMLSDSDMDIRVVVPREVTTVHFSSSRSASESSTERGGTSESEDATSTSETESSGTSDEGDETTV